VGVAWEQEQTNAALGPTLGDKKSSDRCGLEQPGSADARHSTQPQLQAVTHTFRPAAFGFFQCPLRVRVERTGRDRGAQRPTSIALPVPRATPATRGHAVVPAAISVPAS
jgi:hypothetical protein